MERERQNSLESIHDSDESSSSGSSPTSSQTGSIIATSSDDDNEEDDEDEENLVTLLKQQTWTMTSGSQINRIQSSLQRPSSSSSARMKSPPRWSGPQQHKTSYQHNQRPRRPRTVMRNDASSSSFLLRELDARGKLQSGLCSIPEDGLTNLNRITYDNEEEEEPIFHRSPVTIDNGYRPRRLKDEENDKVLLESENSDADADTDESDDDISDDDEMSSESGRTLSLWRILAFVVYVIRCLMIVLFLATVFVIFVLLTHDGPAKKGYFSSIMLCNVLIHKISWHSFEVSRIDRHSTNIDKGIKMIIV